ncbi:VIR protein [Plasmodium vivax]|uniref:VIR protein n=2 Tax=Plasmodium vivax TaxID=5855 RepID=A0A1G4EDW9_PLAVI|nr:VIR protein [Plasmodium vivax]
MYSNFEHGQSGCEKFPFYTNIKDEIDDSYPSLQIISEKILKALCFIYNKKRYRQNNFNEEYCSYLYYWLGDKIYHKVNKTVFSKFINMIYNELYSSSDSFIICNTIKTNINKDTFNKNKVLFDYSKDYKNIDLDTVYGDITCDNVYKEYITKYINMYKEAYSDCYETKENKFDCDTFSKLFNNDQHTKLISFRCTESKNPRVALKVQGPTSQVPERTVQLRPVVARDSYMISRSEDLTGSHQNHSSPVTNILNEVESHSIDNTTEGGSSKTIAGSVVPVLGVSSISLLLYKVTPLGGFIRNFLGRNRNMYNPVEYMDAFNPYNEGMDPMDRRMNISYHRL